VPHAQIEAAPAFHEPHNSAIFSTLRYSLPASPARPADALADPAHGVAAVPLLYLKQAFNLGDQNLAPRRSANAARLLAARRQAQSAQAL
jgi:hypothetical protein